MKTLADAVHEYLAVRRALGFKLRHETWHLPDFVAYLEANGSPVITTALAVRWARQPPGTTSQWWASRLSSVRMFARHHHASDPRTEIPPADAIPHSRHRTLPHLYSEAEVVALMRDALRLQRRLLAASYATIIGLLSTTGMRVSEVLALDDSDVDFDRELLTVRHSKFGKSRHVPLHRTTVAALCGYVRTRDRLRPHRKSSAFFLSSTGARVIHQNFQAVFMRLVDRAGLHRGRPRRPRIHDLRHTFAMATLRGWYRRGIDAERRLPQLSTYLGHVAPSTTYWYLTATPELMAAAAQRASRAWKVRP